MLGLISNDKWVEGVVFESILKESYTEKGNNLDFVLLC